ISGSPCVTYWTGSGLPLEEETVFAQGSNGHLMEAWWIGNGWNWTDITAYPGGTSITPFTLQRNSLTSSGIQPATAPQSSAAQPGTTVRLRWSPTTGTDGPAVAASRTLGRVGVVFAGRVRQLRSRGLLGGLSTGEASLATVGQEFA